MHERRFEGRDCRQIWSKGPRLGQTGTRICLEAGSSRRLRPQREPLGPAATHPRFEALPLPGGGVRHHRALGMCKMCSPAPLLPTNPTRKAPFDFLLARKLL